MFISMQVMESEALEALGRLAQIDAKKIHENLESDLKLEAVDSYKKAWGGMRESKVTNVYRAVKKSVLGKSQRGLLTGSSLSSITSRVTNDGVEAGILGGSWPSNAGGGRAYFSDLLEDYLAGIWGLKYQGVSTKRKYELRKLSFDLGVSGGIVTVIWDRGGLSIRWPGVAKKLFKLEDMDIPSEPYATKKYNKNKEFFRMSPKFMNDMVNTVGNMVEFLWEGRAKVEDVTYDMVEGDVAEVMSEEISRVGGSRVEYDESLKPNIDTEKVHTADFLTQEAYGVEKLTSEHIKWLIENGFDPRDFEGFK